MKKNLMIAASFLMLFASCSKERLETQIASKTYQFETSIGGVKSTKGISKVTWKMGDVMALYGLDFATFGLSTAPDKWTFANSQNAVGNMTPLFCYDINDWRYGAPVAWYDGVKSSFIAIYPYKADEYSLKSNPTDANDLTIEYTAIGGYDPAVATDADIATARNEIKKQTDMMVALTKDKDNTTTNIPLSFRHALSQIRFKVQNDATTANTTIIRVNDITINEISTKGKFSFTGDEDDNLAPLKLSQWSDHSLPKSFKVNLRSENVNAIKYGETVDATDNDDEALIMIPQTLSPTSSISVTYSYSVDNGVTWMEYTDGTTLDPILLSGIKAVWDPNKCYTYTLKIKPRSPITFAPSVDLWTEAEVVFP